MKENDLTQELLKEVLDYNPETGFFKWKARPSNRIMIGDMTGSNNGKGYMQIRIQGRLYCAHRLAWLYVYGKLPKDQLDHINGDRSDNRINNLRECTNGENQQNRSLNKNSTTGFTGVVKHSQCNRWTSRIQHNKRRVYLGLFDTPEEAYEAYLMAKKELHRFNPEVKQNEL